MRIRRLELSGDGTRPQLRLENLPQRTNVVTSRSGAGKSALAACAAHLLYGRSNPSLNQPDAMIDVESAMGDFRLRRESLSGRGCRLTVSSLGQEVATADIIAQILRGVSPAFLRKLYVQDGTQEPLLDWLLSEEVATTVMLQCKELASFAKQPTGRKDSDSSPQLLDELDDQIQRWSAVLDDLTRRESHIRSELSEHFPLEGVARLTLADQRGVLAVIERLVKDLQCEVARFKQSESDPACVCRDVNARVQPLIGSLDRQVARLTQLIEAHDRAAYVQELQTESKVLARSQAELRDRLEQLHHQREAFQIRLRQRRQSGGIRASHLLAELSDGQYVEIQLVSGGRRALVVDSNHQSHSVESLPIAERQIVSLSLSLAIVAGLNEAGLQLPLLLDEPFFHLNDRQAEVLAKVLLDFDNLQLFVFTGRQSALDRFRALKAMIHNLDDSSRGREATTLHHSRLDVSDNDSAGSKPALRIKREHSGDHPRSKQSSRSDSSKKHRSTKPPASLKFSLELQSSIEEFTSIPAEYSAALAAEGIRQIRDLLKVDASKLADLPSMEIESTVIVAWQHQARLCCRIPNMTTRDAMILVDCGFSTPEDIAAMKPAELFGFIQSFASTEEGRTILGNEENLNLDLVKSWIRAARHSRVLGAA